MTEAHDLTQLDVENEILRLSAQLESATYEFRDYLTAAARAEAAYRLEYARAFTRLRMGPDKLSEKTCDMRATVECGDLLAARLGADALSRSNEEICRSLRSRLDAVRTLSANIRSQT